MGLGFRGGSSLRTAAPIGTTGLVLAARAVTDGRLMAAGRLAAAGRFATAARRAFVLAFLRTGRFGLTARLAGADRFGLAARLVLAGRRRATRAVRRALARRAGFRALLGGFFPAAGRFLAIFSTSRGRSVDLSR
jgi:hypothetical protein